MGLPVTAIPPFHLAIPVHDLAAARAFYGGLLGCPEGRSAERWIDFDLWGHQLVVHLIDHGGVDHGGVEDSRADRGANPVDGHDVPVPHFGVVLPWDDWHALVERLTAAGVAFGIPPHIRFTGQPGEQATLFFRDPSGNALEFKAFRDPSRLFAR
jgi:extradiol dioxygenase family protein